jgi:hypothetical protein
MKEWLLEFKKLHAKFRANELSGADRRDYLIARDQLADALIKSQGMQRGPNETPRQAFRVAQAIQVEIRIGDEKIQALTLDISRGGFSALLAARLDMDQVVTFTLKLPGSDTLSGKIQVISAKRQGVTSRFSFAFTNISEQDQNRLETLLFDWALSRINL